VLYDLGRHADSIKTCVKALEQGGTGHTELEAHVALQMANAYESKGPTHVARDYYHKASTAYARMRNKKQESDILYRLGWMAMRRPNQLKEAQLLLQRSLELKRELDYGNGLARYHFHRAEACRSVGASKKAIVHYRTCFSLAVSVGNDSMATRARFGLFRACAVPSQSLHGFLRLTPAPGGDAMLAGGRSGLFQDHGSDGARTELYREQGDDAAKPDRQFLVRLLEDLARVLKGLDLEGSEGLRRQGKAVSSWQLRSRKPKG
jgi:tetratricopeptide (TPR) repeat protein